MAEKFYITTPIYYPSNKLTLGNCYTTVVCDAIARFHKMMGDDVFFLTGTDEHGQKIEKRAKEAGKSEMEFLDDIIADTKELWKNLNVEYNKFIRTTDDYHVAAVTKIFNTLFEKGEIYKAHYHGQYCTPCESFWTEEQLVDGKCPDCGREVYDADEECYNFRLSKYTDKILELYKKHPEFLEPQSRVSEMVNNFLKEGLQDLCVTRKSVKWGIPVSFDPEHTIYVWIDALTNYITALGFLGEDDTNYKKFWPADVHVIGKEIVRFHAIIWPAILMALDIPLPKKIFGHGWMLIGGGKLSKSKDAGKKEIFDPRVLIERYGSDSVRNFLIGNINFGQDGPYSQELFLNSYNTNLANNVGNLVSRTVGMIQKYNGGVVDSSNGLETEDKAFKETVRGLRDLTISYMKELKPTQAYKTAISIIEACNGYVDQIAPWSLAKDETKKGRLNSFLYTLSEAQLEAYTLLLPFLPEKVKLTFAKFGLDVPKRFEDYEFFNHLKNGQTVEKGENVYNRLDVAKEMEELYNIANA